MKPIFCDYPFSKVHVQCDGSIFMCCFQRNYPIGNLLDQSFEEIWFGEKAQAVRKEILEGHLPPICHNGGCPYEFQALWKADASPKLRLPWILCIDLPNYHCNIGGEQPDEKHPACIMCERNLPGYKFHEVNHLPQLLPKLRSIMSSITSLHIQGVAEAFWKDAIFDVLDAIDFDRYRDLITVTTVTNGTVLTESKLKKFYERCPLSHLSFSIDAASDETYIKIRRLKAYPVVIKNLMLAAKLRREQKSAGLRIQNNINTLNVHEVAEMVRVAKDAAVDEIEFNPTGGHPPEILVYHENAHQFTKAQKIAADEAQRLGVRAVFLRPLNMGLGEAT